MIEALNEDIPNQPRDHLSHLTDRNEKEWDKELFDVRKRRLEELIEFDKRIIDEGRKWEMFVK